MNVTAVATTDISDWDWVDGATVVSANVTEWSWMPSTETCIFVYMGLVIAIVVFTLASTFFFFWLCTTASINLHNSMFNSISRATVWFFNNNPSGNSAFQVFCKKVFLLVANASVHAFSLVLPCLWGVGIQFWVTRTWKADYSLQVIILL